MLTKKIFQQASPFNLPIKPGQLTATLTREYEGETIHVEVEPSGLVTGEEDSTSDDGDGDGDGDGDDDDDASLPMVVKVSKPDGFGLEFGINAYVDKIVINSLWAKDPDMPADQVSYQGPSFDELDENIQKEFHKYSEMRGIKANATKFLLEYMVNKKHREYTYRLKNIKKFVEA
ncbi:hypothetical protein R6Q57_013388 [Mikania cordata]